MLKFFWAKGVFARFQIGAIASGDVATPKSPIPPARASGEIRKKGTAVVTTLIGCVWFWAFTDIAPTNRNIPTVSFKFFRFILELLSLRINRFQRFSQ